MLPTSAKAADTSIGWSAERHIAATRLASFTAGPAHGEVEPFGRADVAVEHLADVKAEIHVGDGKAVRRAALVHLGDALPRRDRRGERRIARTLAAVGVEDRERAVADQLEHVAALLVDRRN